MKKLIPEFIAFVLERQLIYVRRMAGKPKPWTKDPILQSYRFCNVHREHDKVTQWIATNWRKPYEDNPDNFFAMIVARLFNNPGTLEHINYPIPWNPKEVLRKLQWRMNHPGHTVFNGAYIVSTNGVAGDKCDYLVKQVLSPIWAKRELYRPRDHDSLHQFASRLITAKGFKGFMTGQVVADLKYSDRFLLQAPDWFTWALSGPGSRRGMNRVMGRDPYERIPESQWHDELEVLRHKLDEPLSKLMFTEPLHAQDTQNCLCEFDKYRRVKQGEGRPKSIYPGKE